MTLTALALTATAAVALADDPGTTRNDPGTTRNDPEVPGNVRVWVSSAYQPPERCPGAQKAIGYYRRQFTASRTTMGLPGAPARAWYRCDAARRRAGEWRDKAKTARLELAAWRHYQYAWWDWMPAKHRRVGACETGYGRQPGNFSWDSGTYVSFAGIYRAGYDADAHRVGNLGWDETKQRLGRLPTPREQMQAVDSHRAAHGGWAGWGCRGA